MGGADVRFTAAPVAEVHAAMVEEIALDPNGEFACRRLRVKR